MPNIALFLALLVVGTGGPAATQPDSTETLLAEIRANLQIVRHYVPSERVELSLGLGEAAQLKFTANDAGVSEFLFLHQADCVQILYACEGERHDRTSLTSARSRNVRTISKAGAPVWIRCSTEWSAQDNRARVVFRADIVPQDEVQRILEERRRQAEEHLNAMRRVLDWDVDDTIAPIRMHIPSQDDRNLVSLRTKYELDGVVAGAADDYDRLHRLVKWVHDRWQHAGDNTPSRSDPLTILEEAGEGKRFRCVEYSIVLAGCAQSLGMPARMTGLKREDAATAKAGAGHVVAEVWLASHGKWAMADGQWDTIPEREGVPLNAVEFQEAFARKASGLVIRSSSDVDADVYLRWIVPYLYFFDCRLDQDFFGVTSDHAEEQRYQPRRGMVMLCPKNATRPTVFQGTVPIRNCTYISNPRAFYPQPSGR